MSPNPPLRDDNGSRVLGTSSRRMAKTRDEREDDDPQHTREHVSSKSVVVGQMTASERRLWEERATSFYEHSDPGEQERKDAAREKRQETARGEENGRDKSSPL